MPVHFRKDIKRWEFTFNRVIAGVRKRATKLLPEGWTKAQADTYDKDETNRLYEVATSKVGPRRTIDDAVEIYLREKSHLKTHTALIKEFNNMHWAYTGRFIDELPEVAAEYWKEAQRENENITEPFAPASIKLRIANLRAACRYAFKKHRFCEHDPAERLILPAVNNERHFYSSRAEVLRVVRHIQNRHARVVILVAFYSGMRLGEILKCTVVGGNFVLPDTKNGQRRLVPMHYKLLAYVDHFPLTVKKRTVQDNYKRACNLLGMTELHFHDTRHSAASEMINAGVPLNTVGKVLGHVSSVSTNRYAHLATDTLADAIALIGKKKAGR